MWRSLDHFHDKALRWCIQLNWSFTGTVVTRSICGSEALTRRFQTSTLFAGHLRGMARLTLEMAGVALLRANYGSLIKVLDHPQASYYPDLAAMDDRIRLRAHDAQTTSVHSSGLEKACRSPQRKDCASDLVTGSCLCRQTWQSAQPCPRGME